MPSIPLQICSRCGLARCGYEEIRLGHVTVLEPAFRHRYSSVTGVTVRSLLLMQPTLMHCFHRGQDDSESLLSLIAHRKKKDRTRGELGNRIRIQVSRFVFLGKVISQECDDKLCLEKFYAKQENFLFLIIQEVEVLYIKCTNRKISRKLG